MGASSAAELVGWCGGGASVLPTQRDLDATIAERPPQRRGQHEKSHSQLTKGRGIDRGDGHYSDDDRGAPRRLLRLVSRTGSKLFSTTSIGRGLLSLCSDDAMAAESLQRCGAGQEKRSQSVTAAGGGDETETLKHGSCALP